MKTLCLTILASSLLVITGCGGAPADQPDVGTVSGVVTLDGSPLPNATVVFNPADGEGRSSSSTTDDSGRYVLSYTAKIFGAKVGKHKVSITTEANSEESESKSAQIPSKYNTETELEVEVKPGENDFPFDLKSS